MNFLEKKGSDLGGGVDVCEKEGSRMFGLMFVGLRWGVLVDRKEEEFGSCKEELERCFIFGLVVLKRNRNYFERVLRVLGFWGVLGFSF